MTKITRALISVSDKSHIIPLAQTLRDLGVVVLSTGGTSRHLQEHGIDVTDVADVTQFPEMLDGRVKTLHPMIHGGILARRGQDDSTLNKYGIEAIDLVVCNLYPFAQTIQRSDCTLEDAIENIDIGGPSMLRSAAKNFKDVTVVSDPNDYATIIEELKSHHGSTTLATRKRLAAKVFAQVAQYNQQIANYLQAGEALRYGENPQQQAALHKNYPAEIGSLAQAKQWQGKPLSFNNLMDSDAALRCVRALDNNTPACVIVKHATPCGVGADYSQKSAYSKAFSCDSSSAFGGIIAFNSSLNCETAQCIVESQFAEVIIAPDIDKGVLEILSIKKNLRVLTTGNYHIKMEKSMHSINGGLLIQELDSHSIDSNDLRVVTKRQPTEQERQDCLFAWQVVKYVKSNAIVYAKNQMTLGIGSGQTSRVFSAEIALLKAKQAQLDVSGAAMASDAFFPFTDGIEIAIHAGITAIIQPGGSIRDEEVIAAADAAGITMLFTGVRHFRH